VAEALYPFPWRIALGLAVSILRGQRRSIQEDGENCLSYIKDRLRIDGGSNISTRSRLLITCNHYTRRGLPAWWIVLAISAQFPDPIHWVMTSGWRFQNHPLRKVLYPVSTWLFKRVAKAYDFTSMPPMPPEPKEASERSRAVRNVLSYVKENDFAVVGLAPEGRDNEASGLLAPPPGAGRFIAHLYRLGLKILPVGIYEEGSRLCLHFGEAYSLDILEGIPADVLDNLVSKRVMQEIAQLLPETQRGEYADDNQIETQPPGAVHETLESS
jgi:1-acyl-sn-glycerol-3-phosphate acyltransferase